MTAPEILKKMGEGFFYGVIFLLYSYLHIVMPNIRNWLKDKLKDYNKIILHNVGLGEEINKIVYEVRLHFLAARVSIIEFSNGEQTLAGFPFNFLTMTFENTDQNTTAIESNFRKIPINNYIDFISAIAKVEKYVRVTQDTVGDNGKYMLKKYGMRTSYIHKINSGLKHGCMQITFRDERILTPEDLDYISLKCYEINMLMNKLKR